MSRLIAVIAFALLFAVAASAVRAQDVPSGVRIHGGYVSGNEYLDMSAQQREAYVDALIAGIKLAPEFGAPPAKLEWLLGCTSVLDRAALADAIYHSLFDATQLWANRNPAKMYRAIVAACRTAASRSHAASVEPPFSVRDYISMGGIEKKAYVSGLLEGILLAPAFGAEEARMGWFLSCTASLNRLQMRAKINDYVLAHDDSWKDRTPATFYRAIVAACRDWTSERSQRSGR